MSKSSSGLEHYAIITRGTVEAKRHAFFTSVLACVNGQTLATVALPPEKGPHDIRGWVGHTGYLNAVAKRNPSTARISTPASQDTIRGL
jgi:hypothetical protein